MRGRVLVLGANGFIGSHVAAALSAEGWSVTAGVGLCWLPVVWIQYRMMKLAEQAAGQGAALPPAYHRLFRWWFALGWPAFAGVLAIYWLMVAKPTF